MKSLSNKISEVYFCESIFFMGASTQTPKITLNFPFPIHYSISYLAKLYSYHHQKSEHMWLSVVQQKNAQMLTPLPHPPTILSKFRPWHSHKSCSKAMVHVPKIVTHKAVANVKKMEHKGEQR